MTAVNLNRVIRGPVTAVPFVAGKGVRFVKDVTNNRVIAEADETVLWENASGALSFTTSESINNFERIIIYVKSGPSAKVQAVIIPMCDTNLTENIIVTWTDNFTGSWHVITFCCSMARNNNTFTIETGYYMGVSNSDAFAKGNNTTTINFFKVVGVNRIASN